MGGDGRGPLSKMRLLLAQGPGGSSGSYSRTCPTQERQPAWQATELGLSWFSTQWLYGPCQLAAFLWVLSWRDGAGRCLSTACGEGSVRGRFSQRRDRTLTGPRLGKASAQVVSCSQQHFHCPDPWKLDGLGFQLWFGLRMSSLQSLVERCLVVRLHTCLSV